MLVDKTYTPLQTDFDEIISEYFPAQELSENDRKNLLMVFFAGAAKAFDILVNTPEQQATLYDELIDHAAQLECRG